MLDFKIIINDQLPQQLCSEHGLAIWCTVSEPNGTLRHILLDTGQHEPTLIHNAQALGIDLSQTDYVVVSHGHYDHSGGLGALQSMAPSAKVFVGPDAERRRFSVQMSQPTDGRKLMMKPIGMPRPELLDQMDVVRVTNCLTVSPCLTIFSLCQPAPVNQRLLAADCASPDTFTDEIFALVSDGHSNLLYGGCTHSGILPLLRRTQELNLGPIDHFVGGLHLKGRPAAEVENQALAAKPFGVAHWHFLHCTGDEASAIWLRVMNQ